MNWNADRLSTRDKEFLNVTFWSTNRNNIVRGGRTLLQSTVVVDLLVVQVVEGKPIAEGQLQHFMKEQFNIKCTSQIY